MQRRTWKCQLIIGENSKDFCLFCFDLNSGFLLLVFFYKSKCLISSTVELVKLLPIDLTIGLFVIIN